MGRGDVVTVADRSGDFTGKPRPAVIVQSDTFIDLASVTICPITTVETQPSLLRPALQPSPSLHLDRSSWIEVDKVSTVRRSRLGGVIGRVSDADLVRLNGALAVFLGIG
jgi:mRNA interferase MazF